MNSSALITLEDGTTIQGRGFGRLESASGEVVFNTGMVGYPETLTDPSYRGQILVLTYPLIGNYGVPDMGRDSHGLPLNFESERIQVAGLVVFEQSAIFSHHTARRSLAQWFENEGIPGVCDVDTRALTKRLRAKGSMLGRIDFGEPESEFFDPNSVDLGSAVCTRDPVTYVPDPEHPTRRTGRVLLLDCGCKASIVRSLLQRGLEVVRVPHTQYYLNMDFDGLVISNGPGDPKMYDVATENVKRTLALGKPIFGICLGNQILARAIGAETYKLKFGHRSHNQPCVEYDLRRSSLARRCVITSQNHGYAVRSGGLPSDWSEWYRNANDGTVEGIRHVTKPFFSVQFHPEATPGPVDTANLFDEFTEWVQSS